eukprot:1144609-Pelagomonas_calceolata.AAC.5
MPTAAAYFLRCLAEPAKQASPSAPRGHSVIGGYIRFHLRWGCSNTSAHGGSVEFSQLGPC